MIPRNFPAFDENTAPSGAHELLKQTKRSFGLIPRQLSLYASSPLALGLALSGLAGFEKSTLAPLEREVLAMTMGRINGCKFCINFHLRLLKQQDAAPDLIAALMAGKALEASGQPVHRLEALRQFILALLEQKGDVPEAVWRDFREAGYSHEQALEVVAGISVYTLTTLSNRLTQSSE